MPRCGNGGSGARARRGSAEQAAAQPIPLGAEEHHRTHGLVRPSTDRGVHLISEPQNSGVPTRPSRTVIAAPARFKASHL
jgi:hypothetical protein